ncbi:hypothetical protein BABINDRAFT_163952 [Babjeviella inositovora NRRL Y-12698]|uniref:RING-type domain-containing protein n=1 Tax=Babjeviella inositovora NRRL Y-12698 TaxID=984486 RepID=A0A1E3QH45_9ASCO|nr:uncharacterized protein BABINDRAFT_163952 [Babjeviella inositovora NRRL Y-12698]ODQ76950.1 hypothetical protein BABINDRAFT_163952 [Babjeviella inositovora NRRL Y-12698]
MIYSFDSTPFSDLENAFSWVFEDYDGYLFDFPRIIETPVRPNFHRRRHNTREDEFREWNSEITSLANDCYSTLDALMLDCHDCRVFYGGEPLIPHSQHASISETLECHQDCSREYSRFVSELIPKLSYRQLMEPLPPSQVLDNACSVCFESYNLESIVKRLPCTHYFHAACIDTWLLQYTTEEDASLVAPRSGIYQGLDNSFYWDYLGRESLLNQSTCPVCRLNVFGVFRSMAPGQRSY